MTVKTHLGHLYYYYTWDIRVVDALVRLPLEDFRRALEGALESNSFSNVVLPLKAISRLVKRVERLLRRSR